MSAWASAFLEAMLERELITLVNAHSAQAVREKLTELFLDDVHDAPTIAEHLLDHPDVVDLHCDDDTIAEVLSQTDPRDDDA